MPRERGGEEGIRRPWSVGRARERGSESDCSCSCKGRGRERERERAKGAPATNSLEKTPLPSSRRGRCSHAPSINDGSRSLPCSLPRHEPVTFSPASDRSYRCESACNVRNCRAAFFPSILGHFPVLTPSLISFSHSLRGTAWSVCVPAVVRDAIRGRRAGGRCSSDGRAASRLRRIRSGGGKSPTISAGGVTRCILQDIITPSIVRLKMTALLHAFVAQMDGRTDETTYRLLL